MINSKQQIIEYFESGVKQTKDFRIGIEHEKFLFNNQDNKRINYSKINGLIPTHLDSHMGAVRATPEIFQALSGTALALLISEGVLYCAGALMLGARWPDPFPKIFGYHEVWHVSVTTAVWLHYVLILLIANP